MKKAVIAMSGGVDSSVAALLMKNEGYDCVGATMQLYIEGDCSDAKAVAEKLNMPFYIYPLKEEFKKQVIDKFSEFLSDNALSAEQEDFLNTIVQYVCENGDITKEIVVNESPFDERLVLFAPYMIPLGRYIDNIHNVITPQGYTSA